jgi:polysaccharide biosynthesis/export protein
MDALFVTKKVWSNLPMRMRRLAPALAAVAALATTAGWGLGQSARPALTPILMGGGHAPESTDTSLANIGGLTDSPITAGQLVHVMVFHAPDFSLTIRVSASGEIAVPLLGPLRIGGLNSEGASSLIASELKQHRLINDPHVTVTVDSSASEITILGEVRAPGIYPPPAKHLLSDILAEAGGLTANTGRVIEISNDENPDKKVDVPWDPTMHNTINYDRPVHPGDRILVRACGIAYVGGNVHKPGAYSLCGSPQITLSELIAMAGGVSPLSSEKHTYLIHTDPDGKRIAEEINVDKVLTAKLADPIVREDDVIYVSPSKLKDVATRALAAALTLAGPVLFVAQP